MPRPWGRSTEIGSTVKPGRFHQASAEGVPSTASGPTSDTAASASRWIVVAAPPMAKVLRAVRFEDAGDGQVVDLRGAEPDATELVADDDRVLT